MPKAAFQDVREAHVHAQCRTSMCREHERPNKETAVGCAPPELAEDGQIHASFPFGLFSLMSFTNGDRCKSAYAEFAEGTSPYVAKSGGLVGTSSRTDRTSLEFHQLLDLNGEGQRHYWHRRTLVRAKRNGTTTECSRSADHRHSSGL